MKQETGSPDEKAYYSVSYLTRQNGERKERQLTTQQDFHASQWQQHITNTAKIQDLMSQCNWENNKCHQRWRTGSQTGDGAEPPNLPYECWWDDELMAQPRASCTPGKSSPTELQCETPGLLSFLLPHSRLQKCKLSVCSERGISWIL